MNGYEIRHNDNGYYIYDVWQEIKATEYVKTADEAGNYMTIVLSNYKG